MAPVNPTPLAGRRIGVTRPARQAQTFADALRAAGASPVRVPVIRIGPSPEPEALAAAVARLADYDWVIFTSVNGVEAVDALVSTWSRGRGPRVAAIGPATAAAVEARGGEVAYVPAEHVAERVVDGLDHLRGARVLLPRASRARPALSERLTALGAHVHEVAAYSTVGVRPDAAVLDELRRGLDAITFTSSSTVEHFLEGVPDAGSLLDRTVVACIGPITAETARAAGVRVDVQATVYTTGGLVDALAGHFTD